MRALVEEISHLKDFGIGKRGVFEGFLAHGVHRSLEEPTRRIRWWTTPHDLNTAPERGHFGAVLGKHMKGKADKVVRGSRCGGHTCSPERSSTYHQFPSVYHALPP